MTPEMLATLTEQVAELVQTYSNNYLQFQRATYNETQVRVDFVNRFFKLLGWDVDNERGLPQHLREVTHEATVVVEEDGVHRSKKPDYSFKVGTEVLYFLETKKPAVNLTIDAAPAFQLRRYGWSGNLKVSVLTNFTDLYIYDCSVRPREGDDIGVAMIAHYHFDEYVERFEEIYNMLSKEAVLTGQFERHFGNIQGALRREPFDQYFLDQIRAWRMMLGEDILCNNPNVDAETLNIFVQRVLNRTIFLRICEDRCFENYVDGNRFFGKHIAVVGSTGSGKSCAVARLLQNIMKINHGRNENVDSIKNSHVIIFDIHSEYQSAFTLDQQEGFSLNCLDVEKLCLPYWLMNSQELESLFIESNEMNSHNQISQFKKAVILSKEKHNPEMEHITYDTPVYFDVWEVYRWNKNWIDIAFETVIKRWWKE